MKVLQKICCLLVLTTILFSAVACGKTPPPGVSTSGEPVNTEKTQLYVFCFAGGFGAEWLDSAKARFEELHKDDVWEEGKKGVQIYVTSLKTNFASMQSTILDGVNEVFFGEWGYYYTLKNAGVLADITDVVTDTLDEYGETRSIKDKLTLGQQNYFGIENGGETRYYGLPHYQTNFGLTYNVELFDEMGYYFAKNPTGEQLYNRFISNSNPEKSSGPDGKEGTSDDGLPSTYEEFFQLCSYIRSDGFTPVNWCGNAYSTYLDWLKYALCADYEGYEQMMLNYTMDGVATSLVEAIDDDGNLTSLSEQTITPETSYKLAQQAGWYYALKFLHELTMNDKNHGNLVYNSGYTHLDAQEDFINAGKDGATKEIAMLMDGAWWQEEASDAYDRMVQKMGDQFSANNRKFAWMPLPKANEAQVEKAADSDKPYTVYDTLNSLCFIKANVADWKMPLAKEFLKFVSTDESLREYTRITNSLRCYDYEMTEEDLSQMTYFGRSLVEMKKLSNIVYPYSSSPYYKNSQSAYAAGSYMTKSIVNGKTYTNWYNAFNDSKISNTIGVANFFNGLYRYYEENPLTAK